MNLAALEMTLNHSIPLVVVDESTGGPFVAAGTLRIPADAIAGAMASIGDIKENHDIPQLAKIHCRELFSGNARLKSPFKHLNVESCHTLLTECVNAMHTHHCQWFGCYINTEEYPTELRLVEGKTFPVTTKHLTGLAMASAVITTGAITDDEFQLAFDPDPTRVDWGLAKRMQATHFARTDYRSVKLTAEERYLLDMADIGAYTLVQSILCQSSPFDRKPWHLAFPELLKQTRMRTAEFTYRPERFS